jgi:hypothetical protein
MVRRRIDAQALVTCVPCIAAQAGMTPNRSIQRTASQRARARCSAAVDRDCYAT